MKKGVVGILILLALVVLVSPAIVGRLAEKSMDENLNWAAQESGDVRVTSENFKRGWFSSEGQHRIELNEGDLKSAVLALTGTASIEDHLPVLVINTKLDHGLIPVSSMSREQGSLAPGLGSAVSTMRIEFGDGESVDIPGTIYSKVGLGGELLSNYILEAGSHQDNGELATWGPTDIKIKTNPRTGEASLKGTVGSFSVDDGNQVLSIGGLTFDGSQAPTDFGLTVGDMSLKLEGFQITVGGAPVGGMESMTIDASTALDGDAVNADATVSMLFKDLPQFGDAAFDMDVELAGADAQILGRLQRALEHAGGPQDPMAVYAAVEDDALQLFAAGFTMNFNRLDVRLPQGTMTSKMMFSFDERDPVDFAWTSLLMTTEATVDISIPEALVDMLAQAQPETAMAIGSGFLVKRGDAYVMNAEMKKGLLNVNGAPIPIPFGEVR